jgi:hypothetical protein
VLEQAETRVAHSSAASIAPSTLTLRGAMAGAGVSVLNARALTVVS